MRKAGILMPVASLPSRCGCGDFGPQAYHFADLLKQAGLSVWQILPLNPLGYGNSPYQPYSSYAMDDLYISLDLLAKEKLIHRSVKYHSGTESIDYEAVRRFREPFLKEAFASFVPDASFESFCDRKWLRDYALFMALKRKNGMKAWTEWPKEERDILDQKNPDTEPYEEAIRYEQFKQYMLYLQWTALKAYVNGLGIEIMGDLPFYVGLDSADVWGSRKNFLLDDDGHPEFIAGVPPDYFSATGQRWGNPIYNWDYMEKDGFSFWIDRLSYCGKLMDVVRVDHFRAFDTYWKIPSSCPTAIEGEWVEAPGYALFDELFAKNPDLRIVAEDLGELRAEVLELRDHYAFRGMRVLQFSFTPQEMQSDKEHLLVYTGTHDNETTYAWYSAKPRREQRWMRTCLKKLGFCSGSFMNDIIDYALSRSADIVIIPMYDWLHLGNEGRLNTPGTVGAPNWMWRMPVFGPFRQRIAAIRNQLEKTRRCARRSMLAQEKMPRIHQSKETF